MGHAGMAFPTWWTTLPIRTAILTGWAGGPAGEALSGKSTDQILSLAIDGLAKMLGMGRTAIDRQLLGACT